METADAQKHSHDTSGVEWARLSMLKPGDKLRADGGFTCIKGDTVLTVKQRHVRDKSELYIDCNDGGHSLWGQADDGDHLVGLYPAK